MNVRIVGSAAYLPPDEVTSSDVVQRIHAQSENVRIPGNMLEFMTGIKTRRYADDKTNASDLAVAAARHVLVQTSTTPEDIDVLIFASASQDITEPATAHVVQSKLEMSAPAMDVKNACNSFINGLQVAEALIQCGQYRNALVCVGETPSRVIRWDVTDRDDLRTHMGGYTFGDGGAAILLEGTDSEPGIFYRQFRSLSHFWDMGGIYGGGSLHPRDHRYTYFTADATKIYEVVTSLGPDIVLGALEATGLKYDDFARVVVHQVTMPLLKTFLQRTCIPLEKVVLTLPEYGNMASASMPIAFAQSVDRGHIRRGDKVMFVGLAGGISLGVLMVQY